MTVTTLSSREFNQRTSLATQAAEKGTVIVTRRKKPAYVLMTYDAYRRLSGTPVKSLFDAVAQHGPEHDFDFEPPKRSRKSSLRIPNFDD